jgi:hypothetical protein
MPAANVTLHAQWRAQVLDVDGNGTYDALTDGLLIERYLSGQRGADLIQSALGSGATRTSTADIEAHIPGLMP